jgi:HD superfamily phosphohydrolase
MILRDPVHGLVSFEAPEYSIVERLLSCPEVQRLRRIKQLCLTSFAYPGAEHTRFAHAVGAAHVMTRFVQRLRQVHDALPFWQQITTERARDAVAAALLHDLGHGPFSHLFEEALPNTPRHEEWTTRILLYPESETFKILSQHDSGLPDRVAEFIRGRHNLTFLANAVSGMFDVDRCDYLLRDAHATGVEYGSFDLDWLLRSLRLGVAQSADTAPPLAIDGDKGLPAIESFILARLFMFQQVYFHKASRAAEWMLTRILGRVQELLLDGARLEGVPDAIRSLALDGDATTRAYLELDDGTLWQSMTAWQSSKDAILSDFCKRLQSRSLFKTHEFFGPDRSKDRYEHVVELARDIARKHGFDPKYYIGLDEASDTPFDDRKETLRVLFPNGHSESPGDVSFLLGRLRGQQMSRIRLIFPREIRGELLAAINDICL